MEYVGFWKRCWAATIDVAILVVIMMPLLIGIYGWEQYLQKPSGQVFLGLWDFLIQIVFPAIAVILLWKYRNATPGKMVISARIVDAKTGGAPSTARLVVRYLAYIVSMLPPVPLPLPTGTEWLPLCLGFLWIGIDRRKQGFHDKISGTAVIYDKTPVQER